MSRVRHSKTRLRGVFDNQHDLKMTCCQEYSLEYSLEVYDIFWSDNMMIFSLAISQENNDITATQTEWFNLNSSHGHEQGMSNEHLNVQKA